ncbi:MAG TPA: response regulator [Bacteroidia bacterium]|jgi:DNA-binding NarL/FixJ family response regulator|nr:response regulator [Bacteroidia bacterium]
MINLLVNCKTWNDGQLKVLIIDDCEAIGKKVKEIISENPLVYVLGQAMNVGEALKMFKELNPDAVFLDINLPDGNGLDTLEHLKKLKPGLKVITFSNAANDIYRRRFTQMGSDYFLDKSKDFTKIPEIINQIISSLNNPSLFRMII